MRVWFQNRRQRYRKAQGVDILINAARAPATAEGQERADISSKQEDASLGPQPTANAEVAMVAGPQVLMAATRINEREEDGHTAVGADDKRTAAELANEPWRVSHLVQKDDPLAACSLAKDALHVAIDRRTVTALATKLRPASHVFEERTSAAYPPVQAFEAVVPPHLTAPAASRHDAFYRGTSSSTYYGVGQQLPAFIMSNGAFYQLVGSTGAITGSHPLEQAKHSQSQHQQHFTTASSCMGVQAMVCTQHVDSKILPTTYAHPHMQAIVHGHGSGQLHDAIVFVLGGCAANGPHALPVPTPLQHAASWPHALPQAAHFGHGAIAACGSA